MLKPGKWFDPLAKYLLAAMLIIVPLFPKFPFIRIPGTYVAVRFEDLLMLAVGVLVLFKFLENPKKFLSDKVIRAFLVFFGVGLVSVISAIFLTHTVSGSLSVLHWLRRIEYAIPFFAVLAVVDKDKISEYLEFFLKILVIVTVLAFLYGLGERYFNFPIIVTQNQEYSKGIALSWIPGSHINSTFAGHYDLAAFEILTLPILIGGIFVLRGKLTKFIFLIASISGLWLLINSISRISQVSYLFAVGITFIILRKYKELALVLLISLIFISSSSSLDTRFKNIFRVLVKAQESVVIATPVPTPIPVVEDRSTSIRINVEWPRAIRALSKNPLLGTGYSSITLATDNDFLRSLGETGLLGFLALGLVFYRIGGELIKNIPSIKKYSGVKLTFSAGMVGAVGGIFLAFLFIDLLEASKFAIIFWFLVGLALVVARDDKNFKEN